MVFADIRPGDIIVYVYSGPGDTCARLVLSVEIEGTIVKMLCTYVWSRNRTGWRMCEGCFSYTEDASADPRCDVIDYVIRYDGSMIGGK